MTLLYVELDKLSYIDRHLPKLVFILQGVH